VGRCHSFNFLHGTMVDLVLVGCNEDGEYWVFYAFETVRQLATQVDGVRLVAKSDTVGERIESAHALLSRIRTLVRDMQLASCIEYVGIDKYVCAYLRTVLARQAEIRSGRLLNAVFALLAAARITRSSSCGL